MIKRVVLLLVFGVAGAGLLRAYVLEGVFVATGSMEPTLKVGAHYFVNKLAFRWKLPKRGEIIVLEDPLDAKKGMIKRVIAVAGDKIERRSKTVYLNGARLSEPYAVYSRPNDNLVGDNFDSLEVPADSVFVLGDNRDESEDSSVWKNQETGEPIRFIHREKIQGRLMIP